MGFQQGLSGLDAASSLLSNISNNISNANTVGFKSSETQFSDLFAASVNGTSSAQTGIGTQVSAVVQQFSQGNIVSTNNPLDMAINGLGFFRMQASNGSISYSRDGQFQLNNQGVIVNAQGLQLTGYPVDTSGVVSGAKPVPLTVPTSSLAPSATTTVTAGLNLPSNASTIATTNLFNPTDSTTYNESTSVNMYDSLGNSHVVTLYMALDPSTPPTPPATTTTFTPPTGYATSSAADATTLTTGLAATTATQAWTIYATIDGNPITAPVAPATAGPANYTLGTLAFDGTGSLVYPVASTSATSTTPAGQLSLNLPASTFNNGSNAQPLKFDFSKTSEYGTIFTVNQMSADGYTSGQLTGFNTSDVGVVQGLYSNGQARDLGQIVLANFADPQGLQVAGGGTWVQTKSSGAPLLGTPKTGNLGAIQSSATESSNVDLTTELVNMLTAQRFYQANAQAIQTQNSVEQTIINLR